MSYLGLRVQGEGVGFYVSKEPMSEWHLVMTSSGVPIRDDVIVKATAVSPFHTYCLQVRLGPG